MSAQVINLDDYRRGVRLEGLTLVHRRQRIALTREGARALAEALNEALMLPGDYAAAGFVVSSGRRRLVFSGWDWGPIEMTRHEAATLGLDLARAAVGQRQTAEVSR